MANNPRRVELISEDDPRFVLLRIHRNILLLILLVLVIMATVFTFGIVSNIKTDDLIVKETLRLKKQIEDTTTIVDNANDISRANTNFLRCAFLIQPDVQKTESVVDKCIVEAGFPEDVEEDATNP